MSAAKRFLSVGDGDGGTIDSSREVIMELSHVVTLATLVVAVFSSSYLNQRALERQMESFRNETGQRLAGIEQRLDKIERQLGQVFKPVLQH